MERFQRQKTVSTVIVNYNSGRYLSECIRSCAGQVDELIVVDNDSQDSSLSLAQQSAEAARLSMKVIRNSKNLGFARGCNQGAALAAGDLLLYLNPDCNLQPDAVDVLLASMDGQESVGMIGGLLLNSDGTEQAGGRRAVPTPWRTFVRSFGLSRLAERYPRLFSDFLLHMSPLPNKAIEVEAISGACMLVNRQAQAKVGVMDESYFMHCEDLDWCMRFRANGYRILFEPAARIVHHKGKCSDATPFFVEWHKHVGMIKFYRKFFRHQYPGAFMYVVFLGICLRFAAVSASLTVSQITGRERKDD